MAGKKPKQEHKSREQLLAELRSNSAFILKMKFIREKFWPKLTESTTSIEDAVQLLAGFNTAIMQEFLGLMKEKRLGDLNLSTKLDAASPLHEKHKELLAIFEDMDIFSAKDYIEGMRSEIQLFLTEEQKNRPLSDLKTRWLDEID